MNNFVELTQEQVMEVEGGCTACKVGVTLITVGGILIAPSPLSYALGAFAIYDTWTR